LKFVVNVLGSSLIKACYPVSERLVGKMSVDRLSNMISSIRNAVMAGKPFMETFYSKECAGVANVLKQAGFLSEVKTFKPEGKSFKGLRLDFATEDGSIKLSEIKRISKPGKRYYCGSVDIKPVSGGHGILVVSTSRGIMSGPEAKKKKLGGEVICQAF